MIVTILQNLFEQLHYFPNQSGVTRPSFSDVVHRPPTWSKKHSTNNMKQNQSDDEQQTTVKITGDKGQTTTERTRHVLNKIAVKKQEISFHSHNN